MPATLKPPAASHPTRVPQLSSEPSVLVGVKNFAQFSPGLFRGFQPKPEGFATLHSMGIRYDIDLRDDYSDKDDMRASGPWNYLRVRMDSNNPDEDLIALVVKAMSTPSNRPLFVHCHHGADRTGCVVATYRIAIERWSNQAALNEMPNFGFNTSYTAIHKLIKHMDGEAMRRKVAATPAPAFKVIG